jgi:hypothetical protein
VMRSISSARQLFDQQDSWTISLPIFKKANGPVPRKTSAPGKRLDWDGSDTPPRTRLTTTVEPLTPVDSAATAVTLCGSTVVR